jgi:hypothetical protein
VTDNVTTFPVAARREAVTQGKPTAPKKGGRVKIINELPTLPKSKTATAKGSGVETGKLTRAAINRIGQWLDTIDCMRADFDAKQDETCEANLITIEAALAGLVMFHQPTNPKRSA